MAVRVRFPPRAHFFRQAPAPCQGCDFRGNLQIYRKLKNASGLNFLRRYFLFLPGKAILFVFRQNLFIPRPTHSWTRFGLALDSLLFRELEFTTVRIPDLSSLPFSSVTRFDVLSALAYMDFKITHNCVVKPKSGPAIGRGELIHPRL